MIGAFVEVPSQSRPGMRGLTGYVVQESGCWEWVGKKMPSGYGIIQRDHQRSLAHRFMYEMQRGPIPTHLQLDHLCRNKSCVRVDHLEAVTAQENMRRARHTHCLRGHPLSGDNLYLWRDRQGRDRRHCQQCYAITARARRAMARSR